MRKTKLSTAHKRIQAVFGSTRSFRYARMCKGCITTGQYFKKGDPLVEMDQETFDKLLSGGFITESSTKDGTFFLR